MCLSKVRPEGLCHPSPGICSEGTIGPAEYRIGASEVENALAGTQRWLSLLWWAARTRFEGRWGGGHGVIVAGCGTGKTHVHVCSRPIPTQPCVEEGSWLVYMCTYTLGSRGTVASSVTEVVLIGNAAADAILGVNEPFPCTSLFIPHRAQWIKDTYLLHRRKQMHEEVK